MAVPENRVRERADWSGDLLKFAVAAVSVALLLAAFKSWPVTHTPASPREITYRVFGTAFASDITYANETNGTDHVTIGHNSQGETWWEKAVTLPPGRVAYLSAQNNDDHGSVVAEIIAQGKVIKRSESSGAYCIATVSDADSIGIKEPEPARQKESYFEPSRPTKSLDDLERETNELNELIQKNGPTKLFDELRRADYTTKNKWHFE